MLGKKGITPIIAVVLSLMMTVAAAGAAYFWMTTIQSRIQSQIGSQVVGGATTQYGALKIISTSCINSSPNDVINITIQNTGTQSISSGTTSIVLSDITGAVLTTVTTSTDALGVNELTTIQVNDSDGLINTSSIYGVKITMPGGYDQEDSCVGK